MSLNKEEIIEKITAIKEIIKDYNLVKHLFNKDEGIRSFAGLNENLNSLLFLLKAQDLKDVCHPTNKPIKLGLRGCGLVKIRPCGKEYENKTYLGFLIGDVALGSSLSIDDEKIQLVFCGYNPCIFVPELNKVIYGYESWWGKIENEDDLKDITNDDIDNTWYVKLLKSLKDK